MFERFLKYHLRYLVNVELQSNAPFSTNWFAFKISATIITIVIYNRKTFIVQTTERCFTRVGWYVSKYSRSYLVSMSTQWRPQVQYCIDTDQTTCNGGGGGLHQISPFPFPCWFFSNSLLLSKCLWPDNRSFSIISIYSGTYFCTLV